MNFAGEKITVDADRTLRREREWNCSDKSCWTTDIYLDVCLPGEIEKTVVRVNN